MEKKVRPLTAMTREEAQEAVVARWSRRDRFVVLCVADYTDLALGLGETQLAVALFACSSAHVSHAHERAARMGHEAGALNVEGPAGEDFKRMLGIVARAWSKTPGWAYRDVEVGSLATPGAQAGVIYAKGDLRQAQMSLRGDVATLRRLVTMYGVEAAEPSQTLFVVEETSKLLDPTKHPMLWQWLANAALLQDGAAAAGAKRST